MKRTARVIVTFNCNRKCPGCCNERMVDEYRIPMFNELLKYEEIIITGGEPMLISERCLEFLHRIRNSGFKGKVFLYTAYNRAGRLWSDTQLLREVDGVTYTIHKEYSDKDIAMLGNLTRFIKENGLKDFRLNVDARIKDDLNWGDFNRNGEWAHIRFIEWKDECPIPENEELFFYDLMREQLP